MSYEEFEELKGPAPSCATLLDGFAFVRVSSDDQRLLLDTSPPALPSLSLPTSAQNSKSPHLISLPKSSVLSHPIASDGSHSATQSPPNAQANLDSQEHHSKHQAMSEHKEQVEPAHRAHEHQSAGPSASFGALPAVSASKQSPESKAMDSSVPSLLIEPSAHSSLQTHEVSSAVSDEPSLPSAFGRPISAPIAGAHRSGTPSSTSESPASLRTSPNLGPTSQRSPSAGVADKASSSNPPKASAPTGAHHRRKDSSQSSGAPPLSGSAHNLISPRQQGAATPRTSLAAGRSKLKPAASTPDGLGPRRADSAAAANLAAPSNSALAARRQSKAGDNLKVDAPPSAAGSRRPSVSCLPSPQLGGPFSSHHSSARPSPSGSRRPSQSEPPSPTRALSPSFKSQALSPIPQSRPVSPLPGQSDSKQNTRRARPLRGSKSSSNVLQSRKAPSHSPKPSNAISVAMLQELREQAGVTGKDRGSVMTSGALAAAERGGFVETDSSGNKILRPIRVAVRLRPLNEQERARGEWAIAEVSDNDVILMDPNEDNSEELKKNPLYRSRKCKFHFDAAVDERTNQLQVYEVAAKDMVADLLNGLHGTVFVYGATGSGKTYTMSGPPTNPGVMPLMISDLLERLNSQYGASEFEIEAYYLEIYNERIRDLMRPDAKDIAIREDPRTGSSIKGISTWRITSLQDVLTLLEKGSRHRSVDSHMRNEVSSRSHAVLQLSISLIASQKFSRLTLCDLAGSERTQANAIDPSDKKMRREGSEINKSLLALSNCISALSKQTSTGKTQFIPFRTSKLTRLLKDALNGTSRTIMIANISSASSQFAETRETLQYADRAASIKAKVFVDDNPTMDIKYYKALVESLKREIEELRLMVQRGPQLDNPSISVVVTAASNRTSVSSPPPIPTVTLSGPLQGDETFLTRSQSIIGGLDPLSKERQVSINSLIQASASLLAPASSPRDDEREKEDKRRLDDLRRVLTTSVQKQIRIHRSLSDLARSEEDVRSRLPKLEADIEVIRASSNTPVALISHYLEYLNGLKGPAPSTELFVERGDYSRMPRHLRDLIREKSGLLDAVQDNLAYKKELEQALTDIESNRALFSDNIFNQRPVSSIGQMRRELLLMELANGELRLKQEDTEMKLQAAIKKGAEAAATATAAAIPQVQPQPVAAICSKCHAQVDEPENAKPTSNPNLTTHFNTLAVAYETNSSSCEDEKSEADGVIIFNTSFQPRRIEPSYFSTDASSDGTLTRESLILAGPDRRISFTSSRSKIGTYSTFDFSDKQVSGIIYGVFDLDDTARSTTFSDRPRQRENTRVLSDGVRSSLRMNNKTHHNSGSKVIVIGAGIAGLTAASALQTRGYQVCVMEARNRIGGQIHTENGLELGAQYIYGGAINPLAIAAEALRLPLDRETGHQLTLAGSVDSSISVRLFYQGQWVTESEYKEGMKTARTLWGDLSILESDQSLQDATLQIIKAKYADLPPVTQAQLLWTIQNDSSCFPGSLSSISVQQDSCWMAYEGKDFAVPSGLATLVSTLAQGLDIRLNCPVSKVVRTDDEVTIYTEQGELYACDACVVAVPLGVLKSKAITFEPPLAPEKALAINTLEPGAANRLFLRFPSAFWPTGVTTFADLSPCAEMLSTELLEPAPFTHFTVCKDQPTPTLVCTVLGHAAREMEARTDQFNADLAMQSLRRMFGDGIPSPTDVICTGWCSDPYSMGTSFLLPPHVSPLSHMSALCRPQGHRVFFAGESATEHHWGTIHGAYLSGLREAAQISNDWSLLRDHINSSAVWLRSLRVGQDANESPVNVV